MWNKLTFTALAISFLMLFAFSSCEEDENNNEQQNILPAKFKVDIPESLSTSENQKTSYEDEPSGDEIYQHLRNFIAVGEESAKIVEEIMIAIGTYGLDQEMDIIYDGDDGREKHLVVVTDVTFEQKSFEYQLTVTDLESEGGEDGGKAMQVFWNNNPVDGVAILYPYNIDRMNDAELQYAMYRIDYSETGDSGYEEEMTVYISNYPMLSPDVDPYSMNNLKMFAGKDGDNIDVYGNSNHPNAQFFNEETGFNWAFSASSNEITNFAVAEVGLPPNTLDAADRAILLDTFSIKNVFTDQIYDEYPNADSATVARYLANTTPPGFFNTNGFVVGGEAPTGAYDNLLLRIEELTPFNPSMINELTISFK